jgi:hypothetical protein
MTMGEMARQENLAMRRHWTMPYGEYGERDDVEIAARIPESWYGPEKKPSPLLGRSAGIRCDATNKAMRNCRCAVCEPYVRHWK